MRIVMLNGQNHKGSTYQIGRMIADKIAGDNEITEFFFPRDLNHFCVGCYNCIEDETACPFYSDIFENGAAKSAPKYKITE